MNMVCLALQIHAVIGFHFVGLFHNVSHVDQNDLDEGKNDAMLGFAFGVFNDGQPYLWLLFHWLMTLIYRDFAQVTLKFTQ